MKKRKLIELFVIIILSMLSSYAAEDNETKFLGTMAGSPRYVESLQHGGQCTYARVYEPFGGSDDLRKAITLEGNESTITGYERIGKNYSFIPFSLGGPFGGKSNMQGGGGFLSKGKCSNGDMTCFEYALSTYGKQLEDHLIETAIAKYFECITEEPKDGDLAVYIATKTIETSSSNIFHPGDITHAGVYRKSQPNWNSPQGGTIESKWGGFLSPNIFQHDVFFVPDFYGDLAKFYRIKKEEV